MPTFRNSRPSLFTSDSIVSSGMPPLPEGSKRDESPRRCLVDLDCTTKLGAPRGSVEVSASSSRPSKEQTVFKEKESAVRGKLLKDDVALEEDFEEASSEDLLERIGLLERAAEIKKLEVEKNNYAFELFLDFVDVVSKLVVFSKLVSEGDRKLVLLASGVLLSISLVLALASAMWRVSQLRSMAFLAENGYSSYWRSANRLVGTGKVDPRVERDSAQRVLRHLQIRSSQAFLGDLPWVLCCVLSNYSKNEADILVLLSVALAGFGFGVKYASFNLLVKTTCLDSSKKKLVYQSLPADTKIGTGTSVEKDTADAITSAFQECCSMLGCKPTYMIVLMNAARDHTRGLTKLVELAPGIPFSGGTTCQGVMTSHLSLRQDEVVAIWGLYDSEGSYSPRIWCYEEGADPEKIQKQAELVAREEYVLNAHLSARRKSSHIEKDLSKASSKQSSHFKSRKPSFAFMMSSPGNEELVLKGLVEGASRWSLPVIGGSSADNDITGCWKQWSSVPLDEDDYRSGYQIESNGCSVCFVWCSAVVQSQLFTGYNATGKEGEITKTNGLRHILEIDKRPASVVYNEWAGGEWSKFLDEPNDANILGPSSLYPLGQVCGVDFQGEPMFRSMHPHLLVKSSNSVTVFSDVKVGEKVCMMTGTKENIVNRIAGVATQIVNNGEFSLQEVRGCLVVFCAGCMMYCSDSMDLACQKLSKAIGGAPYIGMHTFGEQGQFPDGRNRHGNLMFSALVFSSKRKYARLLNVESGEEVNEGDAKFEEILLNATIC